MSCEMALWVSKPGWCANVCSVANLTATTSEYCFLYKVLKIRSLGESREYRDRMRHSERKESGRTAFSKVASPLDVNSHYECDRDLVVN